MEEPNALIRWVIYLFGGGDAGMLAILALGLITIRASLAPKCRIARPRNYFAAVFFLVAIVCCASPPMPLWLQLASLLVLLGIGIRQIARRPDTAVCVPSKARRYTSFALLLIWLISVASFQVPYLAWSAPTESYDQILMIGDSITAGLNDGDDTWPRQLARIVNAPIKDASQPGATLKSARTQSDSLGDRPGLLILEIGGNDLLEGLPVHKFEQDLDLLLQMVKQPNRTIVMFELPLPPFCSRYGSAQRELARKHGVELIPKRLFTDVLTTAGATSDGLHLSNSGHDKMAKLVKRLLCRQLREGAGNYEHIE